MVPNRYGRQGDIGVALIERGLGVVTWDVNGVWNVPGQRVVEASEASWSYMIKPHGSLVVVSSALLRYTPTLSTR